MPDTTASASHASLIAEIQALRAQLAAAERELADLKSEERAALCIYCGATIVYKPGDSVEAVHKRMLEHDAKCPKNPHLARALAAEAALADALRFACFLTEQHPFDGTDHVTLPGHGWRKLCGMLDRAALTAPAPSASPSPKEDGA